MYGPQNVIIGSYFMLRITDHKEGQRNPSAPIDVNAFRTTNFRSRSAMRGAEFHGNTRRDSTTRILSIYAGDALYDIYITVSLYVLQLKFRYRYLYPPQAPVCVVL